MNEHGASNHIDARHCRRQQSQVIALAGGLAHAVGIARALVSSGRSVALAGIEDGIGLLCAQSLDLPQAEGRAVLPHLVAVREGIDRLSMALHEASSPARDMRQC